MTLEPKNQVPGTNGAAWVTKRELANTSLEC